MQQKRPEGRNHHLLALELGTVCGTLRRSSLFREGFGFRGAGGGRSWTCSGEQRQDLRLTNRGNAHLSLRGTGLFVRGIKGRSRRYLTLINRLTGIRDVIS